MITRLTPFRRVSRGFALGKALLALGCAALALPTASRAVTITNFVETPTTLSFNFSGTSLGDFIVGSMPALTFWTLTFAGESHSQTSTFTFSFPNISHLGAGAPTLVATGAYGTTQTANSMVVHGAASDIYNFSVTVASGWTSFSGSFSAVHSTGAVPDGGATAGLAGLALLALAGTRRFFRIA